MGPTDAQVRRILRLLARHGHYNVAWLQLYFKQAGIQLATAEPTVEHWIRQLDQAQATQLLNKLKNMRTALTSSRKRQENDHV